MEETKIANTTHLKGKIYSSLNARAGSNLLPSNLQSKYFKHFNLLKCCNGRLQGCIVIEKTSGVTVKVLFRCLHYV